VKKSKLKTVICGIISAMMLTASVPLSTSAGGFGDLGGGMTWGGFGDNGGGMNWGGFGDNGGGMNWGGFGDTGSTNGDQQLSDNNGGNYSSQNENMIRIMPAGDSITFGMGDTGGYRKFLDYFLKEKGYNNIDFVGPEGKNAATFNYNGKSVTYDDNHAGYSGYTIKQNSGFGSLYDVLKQKNAVKQANPDIILLIIGTNDMNGNRATSACEQDLRDLIDYFLAEMSSDAMLFVSTIPELGGGMFGGGDRSAQIADYNAAVKKVANEYNSKGKQVTFADIHGCLNGTADLGDGVHPNAEGYEKMGKYWANVVDEYLKNSKTIVTTTATTTVTTTTATTTTKKQFDPKEEFAKNVTKWGDANCDGDVDMSDAVAIMQSLANPNKYILSSPAFYNSDVCEAGGGITSNDALAIQKYLLGLIKTLPESYSDSIDVSAWDVTTTAVSDPGTTVTEITTTASVAVGSLNDNFDSGIGSWSGRGSASVSASADAYYGTSGKSLAVTGRESEWNGASITLGSDFKAGQTYSISLAALQLSRGSADIQVSLQQGSGNSASYTAIAKATCESGVWTKIENTSFTIPDNSGDMVLYVETIEKSGDLMNFYIDDVLIAAEGTKSAVVTGGTGTVPEATTSSSSQVYTAEELTKKVQAALVNNEPNDSHMKKQGVQYGTLKRETYFSKKANKNKPYNILLPANYDSSKKYPVLYLLHGFFENENRMITQGNGQMYTQQIIGNAIASGEAKDMIIVVPFVFTSATMNDATGFADQGSNEGYDNFVDDIVDSLMPHIESKYSVATGRENTAVTGFSMGGRESLQIGMKHGDKFGYVGAICPAPGASGSWKWSNPDDQPYLLMITGGTQDDVVGLNTPEGYHNNFKNNNVPHVWHVVNNGHHGDDSIHSHIYCFVRGIFQATE